MIPGKKSYLHAGEAQEDLVCAFAQKVTMLSFSAVFTSCHFRNKGCQKGGKKPKLTTKNPKTFQTTDCTLQKIGRLMFLKAITECSLFF